MRRRKTGRDGFQGWSPAADAAWDRIFGVREAARKHRAGQPISFQSLNHPVWLDLPPAPAWLSGDSAEEVWD